MSTDPRANDDGSKAPPPRGGAFRRWFRSLPLLGQLAVAVVLGELFWFAMIFPHVPTTEVGWAFSLGIGATFGPCAVLFGSMESQSNASFVWRVLAIFVILALGLGIPWFFVGQQSFVQHNLPSWGR